MAIVPGVCTSYLAEILSGLHQPTDQYCLALYGTLAELSPQTQRYTAGGEVSGDGYTAGGMQIAGFRASRNGNTAYLAFDPPSWIDATVSSRGGLIYNRSRENRAVCVLDFGKMVKSTSGLFITYLPPTGVVRITSKQGD